MFKSWKSPLGHLIKKITNASLWLCGSLSWDAEGGKKRELSERKCLICRCNVAVNILISLLAARSSLNQSVLLKTVQKLSLEGWTAHTLGEGHIVVSIRRRADVRAQQFLGDKFITFNGSLQFVINKYCWTGSRNEQLLLNGTLWFSTRPACRGASRGGAICRGPMR